MDAATILKALSDKHSSDVFIPECKNGPTHMVDTYLRMDAWVFVRSWANPRMIGYEIKVSRSDFLNDHKWRSYLPYCNEFYFACPQGVIDPKELPPEAGLLVASMTGTRLYMKKKTVYREIPFPEDLFRYVVMCRSVMRGEVEAGTRDVGFWRRWMMTKSETREIGHLCSKKIRATIKSEIAEVKCTQEVLKSQIETYAEIQSFLKTLGIEPTASCAWSIKRKLENKINTLRGIVPERLKRDLKNIVSQIADLEKTLVELGS